MFHTLWNTHSLNFAFLLHVQHMNFNKLYKEKETLRCMSVFIKMWALKLFHNTLVNKSTLKSLRFLSLTMQSKNLHQPNLCVPQKSKRSAQMSSTETSFSIQKCHLPRLHSVYSPPKAAKSVKKKMFRRRYLTAHIKGNVIPLQAWCDPEGG